VRRIRLGKLLSRLLEQLFVELNNNSNKLLKLPRRVRQEASRQAKKNRAAAQPQGSRQASGAAAALPPSQSRYG
jgi:hypothetical protein